MKYIKYYQTSQEFNRDFESRKIFPHIFFDEESGKLLGERRNNNKIAFTISDNAELIQIARDNEWISVDSTAMTIGDCVIIMSENLTNVDFKSLTHFEEFNYFTNINQINDELFNGCSNLTSIILPDMLNSIGCLSFNECSSLSTITIPNVVESIGDMAFNGCTSLKYILCTNTTPPTLGISPFDNTNNCVIYVPEESIDDYITAWPEYAERIEKIPGAIATDISNKTLMKIARANKWVNANATGMTILDIEKITKIPEDILLIDQLSYFNEFEKFINVKTIEESAFHNCTKLYSIILPESLTVIDNNAFNNCVELVRIKIPKNVTVLENNIFFGCVKLETVIIETQNINKIEKQLFDSCVSLTSVTMPTTIETIGIKAFANCINLANIDISTVKDIQSQAFINCRSLNEITIPESINSIGEMAFLGCSSLNNILVESEMPCQLGENAFDNTNNCDILVKEKSLELYKNADGWKKYADRIKIWTK